LLAETERVEAFFLGFLVALMFDERSKERGIFYFQRAWNNETFILLVFTDL